LALELDAEYKGVSIDDVLDTNGKKGGHKVKTIGDWVRDPNFYVHGLVYMLVRIAINVTMTMQPFYLDKVTGFHPSDDVPTPVELAEVPVLSYIASLIFSLFFQRKMIQYLRNRFYPMLVAIIIIIATSAPLAFLHSDSWDKNMVYPLSAFQGIGLAIMINTATSLISDVIGNDSENSAFVYGCYSLFDKFANGGILLAFVTFYSDKEDDLRWIMSVIPPVCAILAFFFTYVGHTCYGHKLAKITGLQEK